MMLTALAEVHWIVEATADALLHTDIPIIAAVNGPAIGWGMELSLMADIRVASEKARFGELFIKRGLCCDVPGIGRLAQLVGRETAAELLLTGDIIDANRALQIRLVSRVAPHEQLLPTATALGRKIASPRRRFASQLGHGPESEPPQRLPSSNSTTLGKAEKDPPIPRSST